MKKLRIGVLSTAKIGLEKVIPAMQQGQLTEVTAISSRSADTARTAAAALGIDKHYGSYEELLADAEETLPTPHEKLRIARSRAVPDGLYDGVLAWLVQTPQEDEAVRTGLKRWVPEYEPRG